MNILMIATGIAHVAPVGGLGDYLLELSSALGKSGHDVRVVIPRYGFTDALNSLTIIDDHPATKVEGTTVIMLGDQQQFRGMSSFFDIYGHQSFLCWVEFAKHVYDFVCNSTWTPDVIHCHNAHACLLPVLLRRRPHPRFESRAPRTVLTIHNMIDLGLGPRSMLGPLGLKDDAINQDFLFWDDCNCLKAGLRATDIVTTVSETYAKEVRAAGEGSYGMDGILNNDLKVPLVGIVNGIDYRKWAWEGLRYDGNDDIASLRLRKRAVKDELLPIWRDDDSDPIIAFKSRWVAQSGVQLFANTAEEILEHARIIFNAWGSPDEIGGNELIDLWNDLKALHRKYPTRFLFNEESTAGPDRSAYLYQVADFFLRPAIYEPCGSSQMQCQRYGCIPIVRKTGGLADTVHDASTNADGNGFTFNTLTRMGLMGAIQRAVNTFRNTAAIEKVVANTLQQENDWNTRIDAYERVYRL
jgi:starch synthase